MKLRHSKIPLKLTLLLFFNDRRGKIGDKFANNKMSNSLRTS
jgi:hypothetical protein